jgi:hypothetical protein
VRFDRLGHDSELTGDFLAIAIVSLFLKETGSAARKAQ